MIGDGFRVPMLPPVRGEFRGRLVYTKQRFPKMTIAKLDAFEKRLSLCLAKLQFPKMTIANTMLSDTLLSKTHDKIKTSHANINFYLIKSTLLSTGWVQRPRVVPQTCLHDGVLTWIW